MGPTYSLLKEYTFDSFNNWEYTIEKCCSLFQESFYKKPSCLLTGLRTLEEISVLPELSGCYLRKDLMGRIDFVIHDNFVLDVLIINLPYKEFNLASDPSKDELYYQRILNEAINTLIASRNQTLDYIRLLSLHGEMKDVNDMLKENDIHVNHYNLDDFKRVEDKNVQELTETWYFLNEKIMLLEDEEL